MQAKLEVSSPSSLPPKQPTLLRVDESGLKPDVFLFNRVLSGSRTLNLKCISLYRYDIGDIFKMSAIITFSRVVRNAEEFGMFEAISLNDQISSSIFVRP